MKVTSMCFFFLVVLFLSPNCLVTGLNSEGFVLLSFKQSISLDPEGSLADWNSSDEDPCSWNGITCMNRKVVSVSIPKKKLSGFLPSALGSLSNLRHVNLRNNEFFGVLPRELFLPQGLQSLVFYGNSLSGHLPAEIGNLKYLQALDLSQNLLNGSLPKEILQCKRLRTLDLSKNSFSGPLPEGFGGSFTALEKLDISFNQFVGSIPTDIGNLASLQGTLDFSHNQFSGFIPSSLGNLPEKVYIDLTHNNLSGPIPQTGDLINRGPTAFIGNPYLCGPPLKVLCPPGVTGAIPQSSASGDLAVKEGKRRGLSHGAIVAIIVGDIIGVCLLALLFFACYSRIWLCSCGKGTSYGFEKDEKHGTECLCFRKDESESVSERMEQHDLVPLDTRVAFDLDELLKASAFVLGKSGIGIMYKVVLEDGLTLAVRRLGEGGSQRFKEFQTEVEAIGKIKHPNIVTLRAYYWSVDEKLLIYDYIPNGSLESVLHGTPGRTVSSPPLPWPVRVVIMKGIARGLLFLHEFSPKKYIHGDLKPSNILLGKNMEPHISDFGLARLANIAGGTPASQSNRTAVEKLQKSGPGSETYTGSSYQAPEAVKVVKPSQKWDVYSYGVMFLEMITGRPAVINVGSSEIDLVHWIQNCIEEQKPLADVLDPSMAVGVDGEEGIIAALKIAMACVNSNPEKRPTMKHVSDALCRLE